MSFGTQVYRRRHGRCVRSGKVPQRPRGRRAFRLKASRRKEFTASKTVSEFAQELKVAAKTLLAQLRAAGVNKASETDELSETDKTRLLDSLRVERTQSAQRKITVTRKEQSVVKPGSYTRLRAHETA